ELDPFITAAQSERRLDERPERLVDIVKFPVDLFLRGVIRLHVIVFSHAKTRRERSFEKSSRITEARLNEETHAVGRKIPYNRGIIFRACSRETPFSHPAACVGFKNKSIRRPEIADTEFHQPAMTVDGVVVRF